MASLKFAGTLLLLCCLLVGPCTGADSTPESASSSQKPPKEDDLASQGGQTIVVEPAPGSSGSAKTASDVTGNGPNYLHFEAKSQSKVVLPDEHQILSHLDDFSVMVVFRTSQRSTPTNDASLVEKWKGGDHSTRTGFPFAIRLFTQTGILECMTYDGSHGKVTATSWTRVNDDDWHVAICTKESAGKGKLKLYVDGRWQGSAENFNLPVKTTHNTAPVTIGWRGDDKTPCFFEGDIARLMIWNRALTSEQAHAAMTSWFGGDGVQCSDNDVVLCHTMQHIDHEPTNAGSSFLSDFSSSGINAVLLSKGQPIMESVGTVPELQPAEIRSDFVAVATQQSVVEAASPSSAVSHMIFEERMRGMRINGHVFTLANPSAHLTVQQPSGACPNLATVEDTVRKLEGCHVAVNAGYFNTQTGDCYGNLVSDGETIQTFGTKNANFGIRNDGSIVVGYIASDEIEAVGAEGGGWKQLVQGLGWLVREGKVNEDFKQEDFSRQLTGSKKTFIDIKAPRLALGVKANGEVVIFEIDGDEKIWGYGVDLREMAHLLIREGVVHAINLDGGSSDSVMVDGVTVNYPMENCKHGHGVCQRPVTTILCVKKIAADPDRTAVKIVSEDSVFEGHVFIIVIIVSVAAIAMAIVGRAIFQRSSDLDDSAVYESISASSKFGSDRELLDL